MSDDPVQAGTLGIEKTRLDEKDRRRLAEGAARVLKSNDAGDWTMAAPSLYPHQWSWDSAFIALGLAHIDSSRARTELDRLFDAQWRTGKIPHIVFDPAAPETAYFPGPTRWDCARLSPDAPRHVPTSGICQPPIHALAALRIRQVADDRGGSDGGEMSAWVKRTYPRLFAWHRYLAEERDPEGSGLVSIYHPWESGCDNSPRWDFVMGRLIVGEMPAYTRYDVGRVGDPNERPSDDEYDFYVWLVEELKRSLYNERTIHRSHPFLVKDVLFSAILVAANEALLDIAVSVAAPRRDLETIERWIDRGREAIRQRSAAAGGACYDFDARHNMVLPCVTVASVLAPLMAGGLDVHDVKLMLRILDSEQFTGHPAIGRPLPPSASPYDPGFRPRSYWRGPVWPVINWMLWWALRRAGEEERAAQIRAGSLAQLDDRGFAEYFEPFTDEPLGADNQSWTAAVTLDWLSYED